MHWLSWVLLWLASAPAAALPALQTLVDATPTGGTLRLAPGSYTGPVHLSRPMTVDGGGTASVRGPGKGTVVFISGNGVTLRGLQIRGSGESHDSIDAGVQVEGRSHLIEDNHLEDVLFGIHLRQASQTIVRHNRITGKDLELGLRGDAIRVWNGTANRIENNRLDRARDFTFANAPDNLVTGNHFSDGRYGMHIIFSPRLRVSGNRLSHLGTGIVVLYSPGVDLRGNHVEHALTGGGGGIVFKESDSGRVSGNSILHCSVGLKVDAPPETSGALLVEGNLFAHNIVGLFFYGDAGGHRFRGNRFEKNLTTVQISGIGAGAANRWQENRWDDYQGFDRNRDGIGDTPHEIWLHADRIWMELPMATFFRNAPGFELLDFLERLAPFASPHRVLQDPMPDVRR